MGGQVVSKGYWIENPRGYVWQTNRVRWDEQIPGEEHDEEDEAYLDEPDAFGGTDYDIHNGPLCVRCGFTFCVHCHYPTVPSECPVAAD